jgi:hypothetical protein
MKSWSIINVIIFIFGLTKSSCQISPFPLPNIPINQITVGYDPLSTIVIPTATTDSSIYLQQALDSLNITGGTVLVGAGEYILKTQLFMYNQTHLKGSGIDITILKLANLATSWQQGTKSSAGFIRSHLMDDQQISQITLDGNKANQRLADNYGRYGIFTEGAHRVLFDTVKIHDFQGYGFDPHGWKTGGPAYGYDLTIVNCISTNNEWDGFTLDQTYNIYLSNNTSTDNGRHGYNVVTGSQNVIIENNRAFNNGYYDPHGGSGCGFMVQNNMNYGTGNAIFTNNYVEGALKSGFCANGVFNITMTQNTVVNSTLCGLINSTKSSSFTNNNCNNITAIIQVVDLKGINNTITPNNYNFTPTVSPSPIPLSSESPSPSDSPILLIETSPIISPSPINSMVMGSSSDTIRFHYVVIMSIIGGFLLLLIL